MDEWKALTSPDDAIEAAASMALSPATVAEAMEDPTIFAPMARAFGVENWFALREMMRNPNTPLRDRMAYQEMCMKYGQVPTSAVQEVGPQAGFRININIPAVGAAPAQQITLDAAPANQLGDD